jgi:tetratricopeptide (TPR) repeat protein
LRSLLALLAILAVTCAVYLQVAQFGFVTWDDPLYVTGNEHVRHGLSTQGVVWALTARVDSNWLPLTWLSHMLDVSMFGAWAGGHHFTNLVFHAIDTALLFAFLLAATRERLASAFVAALFALHPLHVEVVAWISQRKELLSTGFGLLALLAYVGWTRRGGAVRYAALVLAFAAALAAKPMLVTLPFALLLLDYWPLARTPWSARGADRPPAPPPRRLLFEKLPLFAMSFAVCAIAFASQEIARAQAPAVPLALRLANAAVAALRYLGLALWPDPLSVLYPHPYAPELGGEPWGAATVAAAVVALGAISAMALVARRRPYLAVGWFWFLGTLVPVIGLVQIGPQGLADRYTYVPLIGPFIALAWGARDAIAALGNRTAVRAAAWGIALVLLAAAGVASHARARVWRDSESLYLASLAATPRNPVLLYNLGRFQAQQGRLEDAIRSYEAALAIDPDQPAANNNLGNLELRSGDPERAIAHYRAALRRAPDDVESLQNLGRVLAWRGELAEAVAELEHAARIAPENASVRSDLEEARALGGPKPRP